MSMNMIQTFSFGVMHSFSMFTIFDSRIPRSTTRASSIASGLGGPASNVGLAIGISSTLVESTPVFGVSGYGSPTDILIPTRMSVFPSLARALPSAVRRARGGPRAGPSSPSGRRGPASTPSRSLHSSEPLRAEVVLGRGRQLRFRHGWRRDRRRLLQDVLEGRGVPPPEGIPL